MRKATLIAIALAVGLVAVSCSHDQTSAPKSSGSSNANSSPQPLKGSVDFHGVHLDSDETDFSSVSPEVVAATPLEDPEDKPDDNWPEHVRFSFVPPQNDSKRETFFEREIRVLGISDYKKTYQVEPKIVEEMDKQIKSLNKLISDPASTAKEIPFLPFVDAEQAFAVHAKRIEFSGGKGIAFVTQYNIEPSLVSNDGLTWIFQGFTDDGQKYIVATFPVSCPVAADSADSEQGHRGYKLPRDFFSDKGNQKAYDAYVEGVRSDLQGLPDDKFQPDLGRLEKLIRSIRVTQ
jgi:hypothetical protein